MVPSLIIRNGLDLSFIMWDVDSLDWKSKNRDSHFDRDSTSGSQWFYFMHDIHGPSVNSLPSVIEYLKGEGIHL